jgi:hypothetical protein
MSLWRKRHKSRSRREIEMGYSLSKHSIIRNLPQLKQLAEAHTTLRFVTADPKRLAYKLREAIAACGAHEEYKELHEILSRSYRFREKDHWVEAEYLDVAAWGEPDDLPDSTGPAPRPFTPAEKKVLAGVFALIDVLATALKYEGEQELYYPDAALTKAEKLKLYAYLTEQEWVYIDHTRGGGTGLTLTKKELPEGVAWQPESEEVLS